MLRQISDHRVVARYVARGLRTARILLPFLASPVFAQAASADAAKQAEGTVVTYDQTYFAQYNVLTAEDLLKIIPGIQDILGDAQANNGANQTARRGFGSSGDQILINGRRLSGKNNNIGSALRRIQASQVVRVEVIRGSVPGLDVRSEGTVINIVLNETLVSGSGAWEASANYYTHSRFGSSTTKPGGSLSYTGDIGALNYILSVTATPRIDNRDRTESWVLPNVPAFEHHLADLRTRATDVAATTGLTYTFTNGDRVNLNGRYADQGQKEIDTVDQYPITAGVESYRGRFANIRLFQRDTWEVGGDYEHAFDSGDVFTALFVYNLSLDHDDRTFYHTPPGAQEITDRLQRQVPRRSEKILRASYRWGVAPEQWLEFGGEAAINTLNQKVSAFVSNGTTLQQIFVPNSVANVDENRFESFATYTWQPQPSFQVDSGVDTEYSRLRQRGDVNRTRTFFFVRPHLDLRYDLSRLTQLRARVQRTISQLDFSDFASSFSAVDARTDVLDAGNPELVPEKTWEYEATYEHRLAGDQGVLSARLFYNTITDHIERVLAGPAISGVGNTGSAWQYGTELKAGLRLGFLGRPSASTDVKLTLRESSATDAFTGQKRGIGGLGAQQWSVNFRDDLEWHNLSYGFAVNNPSVNVTYDLDYIQRFNMKPDLDVFTEVRPFGGITARLDVKRVFRQGVARQRFVYAGNRALDILRRIELRRALYPREVHLTLRGTF